MKPHTIQEAARAWGYPPGLVHQWVVRERVPGAQRTDSGRGQWMIPAPVVEAGRPHPSGQFGEEFTAAADNVLREALVDGVDFLGERV
jgi:hypothetical protein